MTDPKPIDLDAITDIVKDWAVNSAEQDALLALIAEVRALRATVTEQRQINAFLAADNVKALQRERDELLAGDETTWRGIAYACFRERDEARARVAELEASEKYTHESVGDVRAIVAELTAARAVVEAARGPCLDLGLLSEDGQRVEIDCQGLDLLEMRISEYDAATRPDDGEGGDVNDRDCVLVVRTARGHDYVACAKCQRVVSLESLLHDRTRIEDETSTKIAAGLRRMHGTRFEREEREAIASWAEAGAWRK